MPYEPKRTPVPGSVQSKMETGLPQRYAMGTTPTAYDSKTQGVKNPRG